MKSRKGDEAVRVLNTRVSTNVSVKKGKSVERKTTDSTGQGEKRVLQKSQRESKSGLILCTCN